MIQDTDPVKLQEWAVTVLSSRENYDEVTGLIRDGIRGTGFPSSAQFRAAVGFGESRAGELTAEVVVIQVQTKAPCGLYVGDKGYRPTVRSGLVVDEWIPGVYFFQHR